MGPLPNGESILVIVDYFSRYYEVAFLGSTTTERIIKSEATPALGLLGLSLSYEMREDFVKFKFCKTSFKLFNLIYVKSKKEAGHHINHRCMWWQLLFCAQRCV